MQQYSYGVGEWCTSHIHIRFLQWASWEPGFQSLVASCNDWARRDPLSERVGLEKVGGWVWNSKHVPLPDFMTNGWWPINKKTCPMLFGFGIVNFFRQCHSLALGKLKRHTHTHIKYKITMKKRSFSVLAFELVGLPVISRCFSQWTFWRNQLVEFTYYNICYI